QAVVRPVEGTILTVAREAAKHAQYVARRNPDLGDLMKEVCAHGRQALANTPELLPVLKQVGVVDAGGQGLIYIYEGFAAFLAGEAAADPSVFPEPSERDNPVAAEGTAWPAAVHAAHGKSAQAQISGETIEYGYCTEF